MSRLARRAARHPMGGYFALAYAISWAVWASMIVFSIRPSLGPNFSMSPGYLIFLIGAAGPSLAALILTAASLGGAGFRKLLARLMHWRVSPIWYLIAVLGPLLLALTAAGLFVALGGKGFQASGFSRWYVLIPQLFWGLIFGGPLEEELGWRGYALPGLQLRMSALSASLTLGVLWGVWHLPLFFLPGSSQHALIAGSPWAVAWFAGFVAQTTTLAVLLTWVCNNTRGSVLLAMLLHAAANTAYSLLAILGLVSTWQVLLLYVALLWIAALLVIAVTGPRRFSRRPFARRRLRPDQTRSAHHM